MLLNSCILRLSTLLDICFWTHSGTPLTVSPQVSSEFVSRLVEQSGHTLIQRIHVFQQPRVCLVVHLHQRRAIFIVKDCKAEVKPNHCYIKLMP